MKKNQLLSLLLLFAFGLFLVACGNNAAQEAEAELKEEIQELDSLSNELDTLTQTIEQETKALDEALDALDAE